MNPYFPEELVRRCIVPPVPGPHPLESYRIFTDEDQIVFLAARLDGGRITLVAEAEDEATVLNAVLADAGLRVRVLDRDMDLGGRSYKPTAEDWR